MWYSRRFWTFITEHVSDEQWGGVSVLSGSVFWGRDGNALDSLNSFVLLQESINNCFNLVCWPCVFVTTVPRNYANTRSGDFFFICLETHSLHFSYLRLIFHESGQKHIFVAHAAGPFKERFHRVVIVRVDKNAARWKHPAYGDKATSANPKIIKWWT